MKRILCLFFLSLILSGCGGDDPYRVDTVIYIPAEPTTETTLPPESEQTEPSENTEETETQPAETEAPATQATAPRPSGSGSGYKPGGSSGGSKAPTEAPTTETSEPETTPAEPTETTEETEPESTLYDISGYSVGSLEYAVADGINAHREEAGLPALSFSGTLSAVASCRSWEISQVWSHTRPDGRYYTSVLGDYGYGCGVLAELLFSGSGDGAYIAERWMSGESQQAEILSESYTTIGVGVYHANGYTYVTCLLAG